MATNSQVRKQFTSSGSKDDAIVVLKSVIRSRVGVNTASTSLSGSKSKLTQQLANCVSNLSQKASLQSANPNYRVGGFPALDSPSRSSDSSFSGSTTPNSPKAGTPTAATVGQDPRYIAPMSDPRAIIPVQGQIGAPSRSMNPTTPGAKKAGNASAAAAVGGSAPRTNKRKRASKKPPTTLFTVEQDQFRPLVQQLTGMKELQPDLPVGQASHNLHRERLQARASQGDQAAARPQATRPNDTNVETRCPSEATMNSNPCATTPTVPPASAPSGFNSCDRRITDAYDSSSSLNYCMGYTGQQDNSLLFLSQHPLQDDLGNSQAPAYDYTNKFYNLILDGSSPQSVSFPFRPEALRRENNSNDISKCPMRYEDPDSKNSSHINATDFKMDNLQSDEPKVEDSLAQVNSWLSYDLQ